MHFKTSKENSSESYESDVQAILDYIWNVRKDFFLKFPDIDTFLRNIDTYEKSIILVDSGDITKKLQYT